ncbi:MAG: YeeE/YedE family protein [Bacteroidales bacterium]|nr:YeeE/YedE family protein [Bacteroidales bacterium]
MKKRYMNPYIAGIMLGAVLLLSMYVSGRGLGASGGIKYCAVAITGAINKQHTGNSFYYSKYFEDGKKPVRNWLTFEIFGLMAGGLISGLISKRFRLKIEKSPKITDKRRLVFAFTGGLLFVYGAQLARGCTSGAALSGMAVLSVAGFVTMISIFASAYLFAWFFRRNWI